MAVDMFKIFLVSISYEGIENRESVAASRRKIRPTYKAFVKDHYHVVTLYGLDRIAKFFAKKDTKRCKGIHYTGDTV